MFFLNEQTNISIHCTLFTSVTLTTPHVKVFLSKTEIKCPNDSRVMLTCSLF